MSSLEPYRVGSVRVEAPTLRLGTSLGPGSHSLLPAYKSGTLLVVGEPGTVFLRGSLRHADGTPVAFAIGELVPTDAPMTARPCVADDVDADLQHRADCLSERQPAPRNAPAIALMTNRAGRFSVAGVVPGRYEIRLATGAPAIVFEIPAGHAGVYSTGPLVTGAAPRAGH